MNPYRDAGTHGPAPKALNYSAWDKTAAMVSGGIGVVAGGPFAAGLIPKLPAHLRVWAALACLLFLVGYLLRRDALTVSTAGVTLRCYWLWLIPFASRRFTLRAAADVYWPMECDEPEGISACFRTRGEVFLSAIGAISRRANREYRDI
jgi:hypothetical protein